MITSQKYVHKTARACSHHTSQRQNIAGATYMTSDAAKGRLDKTLKWVGAEMALFQENGLISSDRRQKIKSFHGGYF